MECNNQSQWNERKKKDRVCACVCGGVFAVAGRVRKGNTAVNVSSVECQSRCGCSKGSGEKEATTKRKALTRSKVRKRSSRLMKLQLMKVEERVKERDRHTPWTEKHKKKKKREKGRASLLFSGCNAAVLVAR